MSRPELLLINEDGCHDENIARLARDVGFAVNAAVTPREVKEQLARGLPEVIVIGLAADVGDSEFFGPDLLGRSDLASASRILQVSDHEDLRVARRGMRLGADDYFVLPDEQQRFEVTLAELLAHLDRSPHKDSDPAIDKVRSVLLGDSPPMQRVHRLIAKVAPTEATIFLVGETGTGKELIARAIHDLSSRRDGPLVTVNCGAIANELVESELFGHERGAFTGANRRHIGFFEQAEGGTLFLDEVTETPPDLQVKLLRVLESDEFRRVGGEETLKSDVRLVATTNRDPQEAVEEGTLREDLYFRLAQIPINIPALRERGDDVVVIAQHFLDGFNRDQGVDKRISEETLDILRLHHWPGNVRELRNAVMRGHILTERVIEPEDLPGNIPGTVDDGGDFLRVSVGSRIKDVERRLILATLDSYDGDKKRAAEALGISLKTLYNRLKRYEASQ
ncbi:MAG: sigma-54 dependent transcriptional regulator [Xanthomonadales bacterium]|nr:sigma-54 dependent transcriptional regulator [Xanthomonadales bacterium]